MNDNTGGFNAPSREAIYYRIHKLAYGESWTYDYEEFVNWDLNQRARSRVSVVPQKKYPWFHKRNIRQPLHRLLSKPAGKTAGLCMNKNVV